MSSKNKSFQLPSSPVHPGSKATGSGISRNSEMTNPIRRSFNANPFVKPSIVASARGFGPNTPANSPSDYAIRKSINRESFTSFRDHEDKENGKDPNLNPVRVRSPAASKGTKNFMSPTISAASKIAQSPKKKILNEKTEPARSSLSVLNAKSPRSVSFADFVEEIISKPEMEEDEKEIEACHDVTVNDMQKEVADESKLSSKSVESETDFDFMTSPSSQKDVQQPDTVVVDDVFADDDYASSEINGSPICEPALAPLDADPSMPPYDPRNNYLSPRPQFLHYKPNPRIGAFLNRDGRRVGDGIFSECFSDSETPSEDSQIESEDASSGESIKEEEEEIQCPELNPADQLTMENKVDAKVASKSCFFTRFRFITLLLVGLVACSSFVVNNYPVTQPSVFEDSSLSRLYIPPEISDFARETINDIAQNFRQWWRNSISEVNELISRVSTHGTGNFLYIAQNLRQWWGNSISEVNKLMSRVSTHGNGIFIYSNLTGMYNDEPSVDVYVGFNHRNERNVIEQTLEDRSRVDAELEENDDPDYEKQLRQEVLACGNIEEEHSIREFEEEPNTQTGLTSYDVPAYDDQPHQDVVAFDSIDQTSEEHIVRETEGQLTSGLGLTSYDVPAYDDQPHQDVVAFDSIDQTSEEHIVRETEEQPTSGSGLIIYDGPAYDDQLHQPVEAHNNLDLIPEVNNAESNEPESHLTAQSNSEFSAKEVFPDLFIQTELFGALEHVQIDRDSSAQTISAEVDVTPEHSELEASKVLEKRDASHVTLEEKFPSQYLVAFFLVMSLVAIAFVFTKKPKIVFAPVVPKKFEISAMDENAFNQKLSWNQPTEVDIAGGSCPSEMSSFQNNGSDGAGEAQSHGRARPRKSFRRESLASSDISMGDSPSFGSFTTYEKISTKLGEDEVITPVRRSSRIRKRVTSP